jgi:hypothetical protein
MDVLFVCQYICLYVIALDTGELKSSASGFCIDQLDERAELLIWASSSTASS